MVGVCTKEHNRVHDDSVIPVSVAATNYIADVVLTNSANEVIMVVTFGTYRRRGSNKDYRSCDSCCEDYDHWH